MTPQEQFEYKQQWLPTAYIVYTHAYNVGKYFCTTQFERENYQVKKFNRPDDCHEFSFRLEEDHKRFVTYLNEEEFYNDSV